MQKSAGWEAFVELNIQGIANFGGTDADNDPLLMDCFEDHPAYTSALNFEKFCILGRKGSGKTAIYKKLLSRIEHDTFSFGHTFIEYPWHHHEKQRQNGVPTEECYVQSWVYLCLLTISKILLNMDHSQPYSDAASEKLSRIERFVVDTYGSRDPDVTQIFSPALTLRFTGAGRLGWGPASVEGRVEQIPINDLPNLAAEVNRNLQEHIVASLNPGCRYYVCFDQLDLGFEKTQDAYRLRLIGLLIAARRLNGIAREQGKRLNIVVFLRDDIYDWLQFEDKNKITENSVDYVLWDLGMNARTLRSLMEKRFSHALFNRDKISWHDVFDESQEMSGRQKKYSYILDRTFLRPRDIIKYCNEILSHYKSYRETDKFRNTNVLGAEDRYSDYFYREIDDEIHKHIPDYKAYLEMLKGLESLQFTKDDFLAMHKDRKNMLKEYVDPIIMMKQLFEFSIIGFYAAGGGGGGAGYFWRYKDSRVYFNENATNFRVHPGFKQSMGLKKFTRSA